MTAEQSLELARKHHYAGDLDSARLIYQQILQHNPNHAVTLLHLGLLELQVGHPETALTHVQQAIRTSPADTRYRFALGEVLAAMQRWDDAVAAYGQVIAADPRLAYAHFGLARVLQSQGKFGAAILAYQTALEIQPEYPDAYNNIGNCHQRQGDLPRAAAAYRRSLEQRPTFAAAMSNLGTVLLAQGHVDEAVEVMDGAVRAELGSVPNAVNLGAALCKQRNFSRAAAVLEAVVDCDGGNAEAAYNLGNALRGLGKLRQAAEQYSRATALRPDYADAFNNLGNVWWELGEFNLAADAYKAAIRLQPNFVAAMSNAGCLLRTIGRLEEAETILRRGLKLSPQHAALHNNLGNVLKDGGELDEAIDCFRRSLDLDPTDAATHSNLAYALSFKSDDGGLVWEECRRWNQRHAAGVRAEIRGGSATSSPGRRIRVGYVSPDFRSHCQSLFTIPLLAQHDHGAFEIYCYSSVERADERTRQIKGYADVWREARALDDAALAELIRADEIDILVDLTMHMAHGRPLVFARRPAAVQIAWLAYPGTTGMDAMDFRLSDPRLDPPEYENQYSEKTIRLPDTFWCYDPLTENLEVNSLPALSRGHLTLGCLNNPCKLTEQTFDLWGKVMEQLPLSRLLLMAPPGRYRERILQRLATRAVARCRVDFVPYRPRSEYLRSYHQIDLGLDTLPYNGHTTSLDSFWMGVPVVTRIGKTCVGRAGLSQLFNLQLTELAAEKDEAFVSKVVEMGNDLPRLAALRGGLRMRLEQSPLMDAKRFAQNVEAAYRSCLDRPAPAP